LFGLAGGLTATAQAQTLTQGALEVVIRDSAGNPVANSVVSLRDRITGSSASVPVGRSGRFTQPLLNPGEYDLLIEAFGIRPLLLEAIGVRANVTTRVNVIVTLSSDPAPPREVRRYGGASGASIQHMSGSELLRYPSPGRELSVIARLSTISNSLLETEGLPGGLSGIRVDGVTIGTGSAPARTGPASTLPVGAFRQAEFMNVSADVEWAGTAAPVLAVNSVTAASRMELRGFGEFLSGPALSGTVRAPSFTGFQGGASLSGPLVRDTASFVLGLEFWQIEQPLAFAARTDSVIARTLDIARTRYGTTDAGDPESQLTSRAVSGFGRVDWRLGASHRLSVNGAFSSLPQTRTFPLDRDLAGAQAEQKGMDAYVIANLTSQLGPTLGQEFRVGWDRVVREYGSASPDLAVVSTGIVRDAVALGRDPLLGGRYQTQTIRIRETLHYWHSQHHVKAGFSADAASYDLTFSPARSGTFWFASPEAFDTGTGYAVLRSGGALTTFNLPRYGLFLQDTWSLAPRFRLLLGARWDVDVPPVEELRPDTLWFALSGIRADTGFTRRGRVSPRLELEWLPDQAGRWSLRASGGIWESAMDPAIVGEVLTNDGSIDVVRSFGTFTGWPDANAGSGLPGLSLVSTAYQGPRSRRAAIQISHAVKSGFTIQLGGTYRRTELLPRRTDLNLLPRAAFRDQYGRPIYGTLRQQGELLAVEPGSNRRFAEFDVVSALGVDGWSDYRALHAAVQARLSNRLAIEARYTRSKTEDNWLTARQGHPASAVSPLPAELQVPCTGNCAGPSIGFNDWTEGVSDFDLPNRAVVGAELTLPVLNGLRLAALYRYQSGYPFTAGFSPGVDANGDGSFSNDPAFIDDQIAGFDEVADRWPCLRDQSDVTIARNSCRGPAQSLLDARVALSLINSPTRSAELTVDGFNLISSGADELDRALYLIDASRTLSTAGTTVTIPLTVNPQFGEPLQRIGAGRAVRVGLRVKF
jgi:hypothetical protein